MRVLASARYVLPVIVVNAAVQAVLVLPDPTATLSPAFLAGSLVSGLMLLGGYAVIVATSVPTGAEPIGSMLRSRGARFSAWSVGLAVLALLGLLVLAGIPGYVVLALTPYVPLAAMSVQRNPMVANLEAIRRRPAGYAVRLVVSALVGLLLFLQSALTSFFVGGPAASAITMTIWGLAAWWLTRLWARPFARAFTPASP